MLQGPFLVNSVNMFHLNMSSGPTSRMAGKHDSVALLGMHRKICLRKYRHVKRKQYINELWARITDLAHEIASLLQEQKEIEKQLEELKQCLTGYPYNRGCGNGSWKKWWGKSNKYVSRTFNQPR